MLSLTGAKKSSSLAVRPKTSMIPAAKISNSKKTVGSKSNYLQSINVKVLEIESMITTKLIREKTKTIKDRKKAQKEDRNEQEKDLEKGKDPGKKNIKIPKVPKLGVFGWLKRFIGSIILAFFANKMLNHLPKLVGLVKGIQSVIEFVSDIGIKLVDGLATFVDWGYKAYDATQGFLKNFGVKQEQFDQFSGALSGLIDALIIGSVILAARGEDGFGPGGLDKARRPGGRKPGVTTGRGGQKPPRFRNPFGRSPVTQSGKPGMPGAPVSQGRGGQKPRTRIPGTGPKVTGGTKGIGAIGKIKRFLGPIGGKLLGPVFFLLDFFGRKGGGQTNVQAGAGAAAGAGGFSAAAGIAGVKLSPLLVAPFPGARILYGAGVLGAGLLGAFGAGAVTDKLTGADKVGQYQEGGKVRKKASRKLKKKKRTLNINRLKRPSYRPIPSAPQGSVTTEDGKPNRAWWDFLGWAGTSDGNVKLSESGAKLGKRVSEVGNTLGRNDYFGPLLSLTSKVILNKDIESQDYDNVGLGINRLLNEGILKRQISEGISGYAEGGKVASALASGIDASSWVSDTFKKELSSDIRKKYEKIGVPGSSSGTTGPQGEGEYDSPTGAFMGATSAKFGTLEQKKMLDAISFAEGTTGSYGTLYGGKVIPELAAGKMTIADVLKMQKSKMYNGKSVYGSGYDSNATGRYQFMSYTLEEEIRKQGVSPNELFTPEMQDRLILGRISSLRGVTPELLAAEGMSDKVIDMLAPEFASFPNLMGDVRYGYGTSYYGQGGKSAAEIKKAYGDSTGETSAIKIGDPTPVPVSGSLGEGYGSGGQKIASDLGHFMKANRSKIGVTGSIHQQLPDHGPKFTRNYNSLHNSNRALDIGGWGPAHKSSGGRDEQSSVIAALIEWNKKNGYDPVQLIHGSPAYKGYGKYESSPTALHSNHVHVGYEKGGMTLDGPHMAMIGEKGKEIVIDNDSSVAKITPMLLAINAAKGEREVMKAISDYAPYELGAQQTVLVNNNNQAQPMDDYGMQDQGLAVMMANSYDNSFEFLDYQG